jgi:hypothetical protein
MIQRFVDAFIAAQPDLTKQYTTDPPKDYDAIVTDVVKILSKMTPNVRQDDILDPDRITIIDYEQYQGTRLYIVAEAGYSPSSYWSIFVDYGSCPGCDAFERIVEGYPDWDEYEKEPATPAEGYVTLALHMVQSMKKINE